MRCLMSVFAALMALPIAAIAAEPAPASTSLPKEVDAAMKTINSGRIRKVAPSGIITTVAGGGADSTGRRGPALSAGLIAPNSLAVDASGNLVAATDNTQDIGASGTSRPKDLWIAGTVNSNGAILGSADVRAGATGGFYWLGRSILASPADGNVRLTNAAVTDFGLLQFGGTTSAFPALKRSGALLQARLADDSGFAQISASTVNIATALSGTNPIIFVAAPTISSGFGTSPTVPNANGSSAFVINVGTGGAATAGVIGLSAAATGWNCNITDITAAVNHTGLRTWQTASTTTTATIESQNSAGAATAWATGSLLRVSCFAY